MDSFLLVLIFVNWYRIKSKRIRIIFIILSWITPFASCHTHRCFFFTASIIWGTHPLTAGGQKTKEWNKKLQWSRWEGNCFYMWMQLTLGMRETIDMSFHAKCPLPLKNYLIDDIMSSKTNSHGILTIVWNSTYWTYPYPRTSPPTLQTVFWVWWAIMAQNWTLAVWKATLHCACS